MIGASLTVENVKPVTESTRSLVNLADLFESVADLAPERIAVATSDGLTCTYAEMDRGANRCGNLLHALGVDRGDRVAIVARNRVQWLEVLLGCFKVGAMAVNVNYRYTRVETEYLLCDSEPAVIIVDPEFADMVAGCLARLKHRPYVLVLDADASAHGAKNYHTLVDDACAQRAFAVRSGDDGYVLYTGGTTGPPKGVLWTHNNLFRGALSGGVATGDLLCDVEAVRRRVRQPPLVGMAVAPLMHGNGQWAVLRAWGVAGTAVVWTGRHFDAANVWDTVERFGVTVLSLVGDAMAVPLADQLEDNPGRWDLSSLIAFGSGGAVLSAHIKASLQKYLPRAQIVDGYGGSESGTIGTLAGSHTYTAPTFNVRAGTTVLRDDLTEAQIGEVGLLAASGPIALGYWRDEQKTAEVFRTDSAGTRWAVIGDNAIRNADGTLTLLGRGSLVVNTGGEKVFPDEVESVLKTHPVIVDAVVVGAPDPVLGEHVAAVIALRDPETLNLEQVQQHARHNLAGYKIPRTVVVVDAIKRSPAGKADYSWARQVVCTMRGSTT